MGAAVTPPGWYPDVERPGGERYWDGSTWTEHRRVGGASQAFGEHPPGYPQQAAPQAYQQPGIVPPGAYGLPPGYQPYAAAGPVPPRSAVAGWALGLSIVGLVLLCCGGILLSIPGTIMGWIQMKAVDRGEVDPSVRGTAKAAFIVGIVGMSLFGVLLVLWALGVVLEGI